MELLRTRRGMTVGDMDERRQRIRCHMRANAQIPTSNANSKDRPNSDATLRLDKARVVR